MPIATREAQIVWEGPLASGTGTVTSGSGAIGQLPVTWASRTERPDGRTSPEELIAAAHASCFAMALSLMLGENDTPPERLTVGAACTLDEVDGAPKITTVALTISARVPGLERADFDQAVERAASLCPVSNALRGNVEVTCTASSRHREMHPSVTTRGRRASGRGRTGTGSHDSSTTGVPVRPLALEQLEPLAPLAATSHQSERGPAPAGLNKSSVTLAEQNNRTGCPEASLHCWNSREWQAIRHAVYRTLLDMTVFPALSREGIPLPNALRHTAVEHGLIDAATGQPTERLLWLNPGLRPPGVPM